MSKSQISIAVVGMGFGAEFVPIYLHHPNVRSVTICDSDENQLNAVGDKFRCDRRLTNFESVLDSPEIDAVHLVTPLAYHVPQTLSALEAGKHCACTVPMGFTIGDLQAIVDTSRRQKRNYMMMETAVYTREFFYAKGLLERGEFGRIQFLRGAHYQDLEEWPSYWKGLPPLHYATHAVSPLLALADTRASYVHCFGSGVMREELHGQYGNPYPIETAIFRLAGVEVAAEVTRSLFHTAKDYTESFCVYGENKTFEWQQIEREDPVVFEIAPLVPGEWRPVTITRVKAPDTGDLLPKEVGRFTKHGVYDASDPHLSFQQGGGHGGSHPHLAHEFVRSIVENRKPWIDAVRAAEWTAPGICAHESAMRGGEKVEIPTFG